MNKVIILGNLGQDPELKYTAQGMAFCNFSAAVSEKRNDKETTEWFRVVCFKKTAENVSQYLRKGSKALVEGKLQGRSWETESGEKRYATEVVANSVQFIDKAAVKESTPSKGYSKPATTDFSADDIPF